MIKPTDYLCHKIDTLNQTELYQAYVASYESLKQNQAYNERIIKINSINKEIDRELYIKLKQEITKDEFEFRHYERELNSYLSHMIRAYNQMYEMVDLDK